MNPIDILGGMLNKRSGDSSGGGLGGVILDKILRGGRGGQATERQSGGRSDAPVTQRPAGSPRIHDDDPGQEFDSLEDLLRHANKRSSSRRRSAPREPQRMPEPEPRIARRQSDFDSRYESNPEPFNQQAEILVIAMINAAKSDGQIDQQEQNAIIEQLGDPSQEEVQFLRREFAKPLDVREFVWSVPLGMERQVYAVSLMAIHLDQNSEAQYLRELGHGFRMTLDDCNRIHREFQAPVLR